MAQPQCRRQRPTPCEQLQAVPSPLGPLASSTSQVGGSSASSAARLVTAMPFLGASTEVA
jgi:hypothetical protein